MALRYIMSAHTDVGIKKSTNQDSVLAVRAKYGQEEIAFAVLCDGMGGLAKGEVASASVIEAFSRWFEKEFPAMLQRGFQKGEIFRAWEEIASEMNSKILSYGSEQCINLGTTLVGLLLYAGKYYIINIGDSRAYRFDTRTVVLTKDHTFVQRELDLGNITAEEAKVHPRRNVLLQCIGASAFIQPDFFEGDVKSGETYMLCSDGFRHIVTEDEMFEQYDPRRRQSEDMLKKSSVYLTDLNKYRKETDNISVIVIRTE